MPIGGPVAQLRKPPSVESGPLRSATWDELTRDIRYGSVVHTNPA